MTIDVYIAIISSCRNIFRVEELKKLTCNLNWLILLHLHLKNFNFIGILRETRFNLAVNLLIQELLMMMNYC
ncbi:hypothetical protein GJ496_010822 [Pomphorhynchus laevis]|nr:hypothetical protein GJ496_010822 [Pomphorhynchus laevis]